MSVLLCHQVLTTKQQTALKYYIYKINFLIRSRRTFFIGVLVAFQTHFILLSLSIIKPIGRKDSSSVVTTRRLHVWSPGEGGHAVWVALPTIGRVGSVGIVTILRLQNWSTD